MRSSVSIALFFLLSGLFLALLLGAIEHSKKLLAIAGVCLVGVVCIIVFLTPVQLPNLGWGDDDDATAESTTTTSDGTGTALGSTTTVAGPGGTGPGPVVTAAGPATTFLAVTTTLPVFNADTRSTTTTSIGSDGSY